MSAEIVCRLLFQETKGPLLSSLPRVGQDFSSHPEKSSQIILNLLTRILLMDHPSLETVENHYSYPSRSLNPAPLPKDVHAYAITAGPFEIS